MAVPGSVSGLEYLTGRMMPVLRTLTLGQFEFELWRTGMSFSAVGFVKAIRARMVGRQEHAVGAICEAGEAGAGYLIRKRARQGYDDAFARHCKRHRFYGS